MLHPGKVCVRNVFHNGIRITRSFIPFGDRGFQLAVQWSLTVIRLPEFCTEIE